MNNHINKFHIDTADLHYEGIAYVNGSKLNNVIIDACNLGSKYEIMTLRYGKEIDCRTAYTLEDAAKAYNDMIKKYTTPPAEPIIKPLTGKYKKLSEDIKKAYDYANQFNDGEDGGTCNLDAPSLYLPRWNEAKVKQAAKEAGSSAWKWNLYGSPRFVIGLPPTGQANRRSRVSEAMCKAFEDMGYEVLEYCSSD